MGVFHIPVMISEVIASLRCRAGAVYVDGTVGGGGHAEAILRGTAPDGMLIGIDTDEEALDEAAKRLAPFKNRTILVKGNFADMDAILTEMNIGKADGILLDLGVSSHQLDTAYRGFSFTLDAPLDMRMDRSRGSSAYDLIQTLPEEELERIIRKYGEERMARRVARSIVEKRKVTPIRTTADLAAVVVRALPHVAGRQRIHPATRTFQALRIAVNDELTGLHRAITDGMERLGPGGRFSVISFHSLEDRIVKSAFRIGEKGCICPPDLPVCACRRTPTLKVITRKPIIPGEAEITSNPRSRSAKLRTAERI
ncbi:MAG TPA: 16S rRNA (cytosine(1402)-N(4))-methyltransferase [Syntrophus sp. (in: bacteria)]|nr:MAG: 16S rRNA (cytosine(1402)-N(4))-methyltransferase [Syntrophus sp. GWC2_56_31]HBB15667.1 16S rRNA (cytosine(1402)-N(4))-methyltransferase [Syntrophus sp. (in: bacteria)]